VKVSSTTTSKRCKGGQFIPHAKALPGNPYGGRTLRWVLEETEALTGREIEPVYVDKGYVGHDASKPRRVFRSERKHGVHGQIKKELRRRSAIEAMIGHCKSDGHLDHNHLNGRQGDQINAVMRPAGYIQLPSHTHMAEASLTQNHRRHMGRDNTILNAQNGFLTADYLSIAAMSASTISCTSSGKLTRCCQPSFSLALLGSPSRVSTSVGR
jgi:IS5 family transposase